MTLEEYNRIQEEKRRALEEQLVPGIKRKEEKKPQKKQAKKPQPDPLLQSLFYTQSFATREYRKRPEGETRPERPERSERSERFGGEKSAAPQSTTTPATTTPTEAQTATTEGQTQPPRREEGRREGQYSDRKFGGGRGGDNQRGGRYNGSHEDGENTRGGRYEGGQGRTEGGQGRSYGKEGGYRQAGRGAPRGGSRQDANFAFNASAFPALS